MNYRGKRREEKIRTIKIGVIMLIVMILAILLTYLLEAKNEADTEIWQAERQEPVTRAIATPEPTPMPTPEPTPYITLTDNERTLVATVCESEDNIHGLDGLLAVACTIRNRYEDGRFGDGIENICIASQFHGLYADVTPSEDAYKAVDMVFFDGCEDITEGGLYFCTGDGSNIKAGLSLTEQVGGHNYYTDKEVEA